MKISEKQIMRLLICAMNYLDLETEEISKSWVKKLIEDLTNQQSDELREVK